jgi:hypothetical protein
MDKNKTTFSEELNAIGTVLTALEPLDAEKRKFVLKTVIERLAVPDLLPAAPATPAANLLSATAAAASPLAIKGISAKDFMKAKNPQTDSQRIACLAYYFTHNKGQNEFKTADFTQLNEEAKGIRFSNAGVAVMNATDQSKFLAPVGDGKKRITTLGEEVVEVLPDQEAVKKILASNKSTRRKKTRTKSASKASK